MSKHSVEDLADDPENDKYSIDLKLKHIDDKTCKIELFINDYSDMKSIVLMLDKTLESGLDRGYEKCQMDVTSFDWNILKLKDYGWKEVSKDDDRNIVVIESDMEKFSEFFAKSLGVSK
jgi:hypothetical protein